MSFFLLIAVLLFVPTLVAALIAAVLDWLVPRVPISPIALCSGWAAPAAFIAFGIIQVQGRSCPPYGECGGLGEGMLYLLGFGMVVAGVLLGPFAAYRVLVYLRRR